MWPLRPVPPSDQLRSLLPLRPTLEAAEVAQLSLFVCVSCMCTGRETSSTRLAASAAEASGLRPLRLPPPSSIEALLLSPDVGVGWWTNDFVAPLREVAAQLQGAADERRRRRERRPVVLFLPRHCPPAGTRRRPGARAGVAGCKSSLGWPGHPRLESMGVTAAWRQIRCVRGRRRHCGCCSVPRLESNRTFPP